MEVVETEWLFFNKFYCKRTRTKKRTPEAPGKCEGDDYEKKKKNKDKHYFPFKVSGADCEYEMKSPGVTW